MNRHGETIPMVGFGIVKHRLIMMQCEGHGSIIERRARLKVNGVMKGKGKPKSGLSLNIWLDAQRYIWALILRALDVCLSNGRNV
jgi:hypothetical protein